MGTVGDYTSEMLELIVSMDQKVKELRDSETQETNKRIKEISADFADDPELRKELINDLLSEKKEFLSQMTRLLQVNADQIERINRLSVEMARSGVQTIQDILKPIVGAGMYAALSDSLNDNTVIDKKTEYIESTGKELK